jgi:hypothetical protein
VQRNSFGEGCAYRLDQNTLEIQAGQQFLEGSPLAGFTGVVCLLSQGDTECTGIHRDLGDIDAVGRRP